MGGCKSKDLESIKNIRRCVMKLTPNLSLKKPEGTDIVNINDFNDNADVIDVELVKLATPTASGRMSAADKSKLDGVASGAKNYTHPASHPPSIIAQDASNRFVTDVERNKLNGITAGAQVNRAQATTAQATAGTDTTTDMSPQRTLQVIDSRTRYGVTTGTATALVLTLSPAPTALYTGMEVKIKLHLATGTNPTLNVNGLGARALFDSDGARFSGESGKIYTFVYDGTNFIQVSGGGGGGKLNVYTGTSQPTKKEGVWINSAVTKGKVISDDSLYSSGSWYNGPTVVTLPIIGGSASFIGANATIEVDGIVYHLYANSTSSSGAVGLFSKYNEANNTWSTLQPPGGLAYMSGNQAHMSYYNGYIYAIGFYRPTTVIRYHIATNTWSTSANIAYSPETGSSVVIGNKVFFIQGSGGTSKSFDMNTLTFSFIKAFKAVLE